MPRAGSAGGAETHPRSGQETAGASAALSFHRPPPPWAGGKGHPDAPRGSAFQGWSRGCLGHRRTNVGKSTNPERITSCKSSVFQETQRTGQPLRTVSCKRGLCGHVSRAAPPARRGCPGAGTTLPCFLPPACFMFPGPEEGRTLGGPGGVPTLDIEASGPGLAEPGSPVVSSSGPHSLIPRAPDPSGRLPARLF